MASTNKTKNFQLPQWSGSDHPTFQGDMNDAFKKIDDGMQKNKEDINTIINSGHEAPNYVQITCEMFDNGFFAYQSRGAREAVEKMKRNNSTVSDSFLDADDEFRRY